MEVCSLFTTSSLKSKWTLPLWQGDLRSMALTPLCCWACSISVSPNTCALPQSSTSPHSHFLFKSSCATTQLSSRQENAAAHETRGGARNKDLECLNKWEVSFLNVCCRHKQKISWRTFYITEGSLTWFYLFLDTVHTMVGIYLKKCLNGLGLFPFFEMKHFLAQWWTVVRLMNCNDCYTKHTHKKSMSNDYTELVCYTIIKLLMTIARF